MATSGRKLSVQFTAIGARILRKLLADSVLREIEDATEEHATLILEEIRHYPPPPPNSTYIRTSELYNSWRVRRAREGQNILYVIENDATDPRGRKYATFVQGTLQTSMHASTGWKNINDYTRRSVFQSSIQGIIASAARGYTFGR